MTAAPPPRTTLNRTTVSKALASARVRRNQRSDAATLRGQLLTYQTASEISELSGIAARNAHVDTAEVRTVLSRQLSR